VANLGVNYAYAGRLAKALPLLEEGYRASKKFPGLRWVGVVLADGYARAGKTAEAAGLVKELIADARRTLPPDSPQLAGKLLLLGTPLLTIKAYAAAEPILRESLAIRAKQEPDAWTTFNTRSLLGGALLGQARNESKGGDKEALARAAGLYKEAEALLLGGYQGMKKRAKAVPPQGRPRLPEAVDRLVELYTATSRPDELKKWQAERANYPEVKDSAALWKK